MSCGKDEEVTVGYSAVLEPPIALAKCSWSPRTDPALCSHALFLSSELALAGPEPGGSGGSCCWVAAAVLKRIPFTFTAERGLVQLQVQAGGLIRRGWRGPLAMLAVETGTPSLSTVLPCHALVKCTGMKWFPARLVRGVM